MKQRPHNAFLIRNCRFHVRESFKKSKTEECSEFFRNLHDVNPYDRIRKAYRFIRAHKQIHNRVSGARIPLSAWEQLLSHASGPIIPLITEKDHWPLGPPPSRDEVDAILLSIRRGTAPGLDQVSIDLLQSLPNVALDLLTYVFKQVWITNVPPSEWLETVQFPLPKKPRPTCLTDYRRITLSDTGYRVYARILLERLDSMHSGLGSYQAAFIRNRSADDHMYVLRRVIDEEWKAGETVYVLSLDLKQAFDTVDLSQTSIILAHLGIPHHLVNRIICTCMHEKSSIIWCNQRTQAFQRGVGLKQGCPISPTLFNLVIDSVLQTVSELVPELKLDQDNSIQFPMILAYADDLLVIGNRISCLDRIISEFIPLLSSVGLKVNEEKSSVLVRPQCSDASLLISGFRFKVCSTLRYLGTYLTADVNRSETIRTRCKQASGVVKMLSNFIHMHKIPFDLVIQMYKQLVAPVMTYGLRAATLTKAIRLRLARYEKCFLIQMLRNCSCRPQRLCIRRILHGKTINRKVSAYRVYYWGHIFRRPRGHILNAAKAYSRSYRKIGRPIFTWNDSIRKDLEAIPVVGHVLESAAQRGKVALKREVDKIYDSDRSSSNESDDYCYGSD